MKTIDILNTKKACLYIKHGVKPINIGVTKYKGQDRLVFTFDTFDTDEVYKLWKASKPQ